MKAWQAMYSLLILMGGYVAYLVLSVVLEFMVYFVSFAVIGLPTISYLKWYFVKGRHEIKKNRTTNFEKEAVKFSKFDLLKKVGQSFVSLSKAVISNIKLVGVLIGAIFFINVAIPESLDAIFEKISLYVFYFSTLIIVRATLYLKLNVKTPSYLKALFTPLKS